jgi:O-antigen/teichoic acid export membrane protein
LVNRLKKLSTFRRGFLSTLVLDVAGRGLTALATIGFIRALGVGSFAYLILFLNIGQFAGLALTGGIRMRYMRIEAERVSRDEGGTTGFGLATATSMLLVFAVATFCLALVAVLHTGGSTDDRLLFVALTAAYTAGNAAVELAVFHYQAHLRFVRGGLVGVARGASIIVVAILALTDVVQSGPATAAAVAGALVGVATLICAPLMRETLSSSLRGAFSADFARESAWLTVYYMASAGFAYADLFIVAGMLNDEAVSSYGAALRYIAIIVGPLPALVAVIRVRTSQSDVVESAGKQADMLRDWVRKSLAPGTAIVGFAALAAPFVIPILDKGRYPLSIPIFECLLVATFVDYLTLPAPNLMMARRRYRLLAYFYLIALALQLLLAGGVATTGSVVAVAAVASAVGALEATTIAYLAVRLARREAARPAGTSISTN